MKFYSISDLHVGNINGGNNKAIPRLSLNNATETIKEKPILIIAGDLCENGEANWPIFKAFDYFLFDEFFF